MIVPLLLAAFAFNLELGAQDSPCIYRLELMDNLGDGWNGASLTVHINEQVRDFTLRRGDSSSIYLPLYEGDRLEVTYNPGDADEDVKFAMYTETGETIFSEIGVVPFRGNNYLTFVNCASCPTPPVSSIVVDRLLAFSAEIKWMSPDPDGVYAIEIGPGGIQPGEGQTIPARGNRTGRLALEENTEYTFYLTTFCANGDSSQVLGPFNFRTIFANDVGAVDVLTPLTDCGLSAMDSVVVSLQNFGEFPQSLIPFRFSVNGEPVEIDSPRDGLYTGVLGKDSTDFAEFDATFDFSEPGEYYLETWTEFADDGNNLNDTTAVTFYSIPTLSEFPYREGFESRFSGWTVDPASEASSWELGAPIGGVINQAAEGRQVWATNLNGAHNASELSYLLSPCMDFSGLAEDPLISFQLWSNTELDRDQLWLEYTTDGGANWERVRSLNYNGPYFSYTGDSPDNNWERQFGTLEGLAGESDVRLRFAFFSDFATELEGVALDDISIYPRGATDLLLNSISTTGNLSCSATEEDFVQVQVTNIGETLIDDFTLAYQINGGIVMSTPFTGQNLDTTQSDVVSLNIPIESRGVYDILAWVSNPEDANPTNDTLRFRVTTTFPVPFSEDFETGTFPARWERVGMSLVTNGHGNSSYVFAQNMRLQNPRTEVTTPVFGPVQAGDSLSFDYRFVNFDDNGPALLTASDQVNILIAEGCSEEFQLVGAIDMASHFPTIDFNTMVVDLDDYIGQTIRVKIVTSWGGGNYWFDLDNFLVPRCNGDIRLQETFSERADGTQLLTITPIDGQGPYQFDWSTGDHTATVEIPSQIYTLVVTDRFGCTGSYFGLPVNVEEFSLPGTVALFPNPTHRTSELQLEFEQPADTRIQVLNALGQPILEYRENKLRTATYPIDLSRQSSGLYFVRVIADGRIHTEKLLKVNN